MKDPEEVLKENPGSVIFARYAEELARNGKIDEAIEVLSKGINANPDYAAGYSVLAEINANQKLYEAAIEHLKKSLSLKPQAPRDIFNLGKYFIDNQPEKAKDYLWKAHHYEPGASDVKNALKEALSKTGEAGEIDLLPDTEGVHPEMVGKVKVTEEVEEATEETTGVDESIPEEIPEETEISIPTEGDETQLIEETETEESTEEETGVEAKEIIIDESASIDITMAPETEDALSELVEEVEISEEIRETTEETTGVDEIIPEEFPEETEISIPTEGDETQLIEETETEESTEEETGVEAKEIITDESTVQDIELSSETEDALSELIGEVETSEEIEKKIEETTGLEESIPDEPRIETDISEPFETGETQPVEETEFEEPLKEETATEAEKDIRGEADSELTDSKKDERTEEEILLDDLAQPLEQEIEEIPPEAEEKTGEIEEELPGYSEILGKDSSKEFDSLMTDQKDNGVLEIEDEGNEYDMSKLDFDLSAEEAEGPVLTEEERAELLALEESPQDVDKDTNAGESGVTQLEDSELSSVPGETIPEIEMKDSDETITENLYGDLSKDEIEVLSVTDTQPDDVEKHLQIETEEGIDYSDILYGHEPSIESEDTPDTVSEEKLRSEDELELESSIEDVSPPETKEDDILDAPIDTEDIITDEQEKPDIIDEASAKETIPDEKQERESGESESVDESYDSIADDTEILEDASESPQYFGLPVDEEEISDVENSSLDELIGDYVTALKDSHIEPENGEIEYPEEDISPESLTEEKEVELELTGEKPLDIEVEEEISPAGEATVTMAEIFVSQGLIPRAIEIYKVLLEQKPDDEEIQVRLEELQKMLDAQSGAE